MSTRTIAIRITIDNRDAINAAKAQAIAMREANKETERQTHLQGGLTASFVKGNLAARAISISFLALRDSIQFALKTGLEFEHNMTKISAITGATGGSLNSLESTIRGVAIATNQSQNEMAKTALEMGKMGLSSKQVEDALGGVAKLARALDEDLIRTGETVVAVLNAYRFGAEESGRITDQLAFTVKASALSIETFGTAFSYVGGTAKAAGVRFEELQASMDVLSNAGIKASTIGTQLRRIIVDLADESSKAGKIIGGETLRSVGGLANALDLLGEKNLNIADYTEIFGRTASSVASILTKYTDVIRTLEKQTADATGITDKMSDQMNTTLLSALQGVKTAWGEVGIEIMKSNGLLKDFFSLVKSSASAFADNLSQDRMVDKFRETLPREDLLKIMSRMGHFQSVFTGSNKFLAEQPEFQAFLQGEAMKEQIQKSKDNIVGELQNLLDADAAKAMDKSVKNWAQNIPFKEGSEIMVRRLREMFANDMDKFADAKTVARGNLGLKMEDDPEKSILAAEAAVAANIKSANKKLAIMEEQEKAREREMLQIEALITWAEKETAEYHKLERQWKKNIEEMDGLTDAYFKFLEQTTLGNVMLTESFTGLATGLNSIAFTFGEQLVESVVRGKNAFKDFDDMFGQLAKQLTAQLIALTIRFLIFKAIVSSLGLGAPGAAFSSFAFNGTQAGGFMSAFLGGLGGKQFASGTDQYVDRPTMFMAGESGRERVTVSPRGSSRGSGGGITVNIQGDVYGGEKFREAIAEANSRMGRNQV